MMRTTSVLLAVGVLGLWAAVYSGARNSSTDTGGSRADTKNRRADTDVATDAMRSSPEPAPRVALDATGRQRRAAATGLRAQELLAALASAPDDDPPEHADLAEPASTARPVQPERAGELPEIPQTPQRARLERAYRAEAHDPARTRQTSDYLKQLASAVQVDPQAVRETDCHTTVCRVRLSFREPMQAMRFNEATKRGDFPFELAATRVSGLTGDAESTAPWEIDLLLGQTDGQ